MAVAENVIFRIGGIHLGLSIKILEEFLPLGRFPDFIINGSSEVNYQITRDPEPGRPEGTLVFDSEQAWRLFFTHDNKIVWIGSRDYVPRLVGRFALNFRTGEISVTKDESGKYIFPLSYPMGELLMVNLLGTGLGIMLHACAVITGDTGLIFAGTGGTGKTTTGRLWSQKAGVKILNDDRVIVRKLTSQFRVYGTPWHGEGGFALAEDAPLKKIFILEQALSNYAIQISPAQAAAALLVRSFTPLWDAEAMTFTLQFLDDLCQSVQCYRLGFLPDQSFVEYVRCLSSS